MDTSWRTRHFDATTTMRDEGMRSPRAPERPRSVEQLAEMRRVERLLSVVRSIPGCEGGSDDSSIAKALAWIAMARDAETRSAMSGPEARALVGRVVNAHRDGDPLQIGLSILRETEHRLLGSKGA